MFSWTESDLTLPILQGVGGLILFIIIVYVTYLCCKACNCDCWSCCRKQIPAADICREPKPQYDLKIQDFYGDIEQSKATKKNKKIQEFHDISSSDHSTQGLGDKSLPHITSNNEIGNKQREASFYVINDASMKRQGTEIAGKSKKSKNNKKVSPEI